MSSTELQTRFHVRLASSLDELSELKSEWNELAAGQPMRRFEWLATWWRHFGQEESKRLNVVTVRDDNGTIFGLAPWYTHQRFDGSCALRCLGSGIVCTDYQTIFSRPGSEDRVALTVAEWLANEDHHWSVLEIPSVSPYDRIIPALAAHMQHADFTLHTRPGLASWRTDLPDSWDAFQESLSSNKRYKIRRFIRRYLESGPASFHRVQNINELPQAFETFRLLHQKRRESVGDAGCFSVGAFGSFLSETAESLRQAGLLDLCWLELEGQPIAAGFNLVGSDTTFDYQAGFDPAALRHEPGKILTALKIRNAIERGHGAYDFLRGNEPYKQGWNARQVPMLDYRIVSRRTSDRVRHGLWLATQQAKGWAKQAVSAASDYRDSAVAFVQQLARTEANRVTRG